MHTIVLNIEYFNFISKGMVIILLKFWLKSNILYNYI